jgi:hypothetical protein
VATSHSISIEMRSGIAKNGREEDVLAELDREASRPTHAALCWSIARVYLLAFAVAVYYRITISDWLAAHLPL